MTADDRSHTADALTEVADYHVAECIDMHGDQGEDGPRPDCCFHARAAYAVGDAARLLRTTPTDSERASTHSAECWRWHGDCARARLVEVTAEREAEEPARPENADYWRDRLNDHKASLAIQAFTAPGEDEAVMMESLVARISDCIAERDAERAGRERAEAEARQLREAIRAHENLHRPDGPDGADGPIEMDGWPCCNDDRLLWAAAVAEVAEDRGQTDG